MIPVTHPLPMIYQCLLYSKSCWILLVPGDYPLRFCVTGGDETWRVERCTHWPLWISQLVPCDQYVGYVSGVLMHNLCTLVNLVAWPCIVESFVSCLASSSTILCTGWIQWFFPVCPMLWIMSIDICTFNLMPILLDFTFWLDRKCAVSRTCFLWLVLKCRIPVDLRAVEPLLSLKLVGIYDFVRFSRRVWSSPPGLQVVTSQLVFACERYCLCGTPQDQDCWIPWYS